MRRSTFFGMVISGLCLFSSVASAAAEDTDVFPRVKALLAAWPAGSIDSIEKANEALSAIESEKKLMERDLLAELDACVKKFLVTRCQDERKLLHLQNRSVLKSLQVEADRFRRTERVRLRDEALVDREQRSVAKAPQREASRKKFEEMRARYADDLHKTADIVVKDGVYSIMTPSEPVRPVSSVTPQKRAQNLGQHEEKRLESERKQEAVRERTARTQARRERRAKDALKEDQKKIVVVND